MNVLRFRWAEGLRRVEGNVVRLRRGVRRHVRPASRLDADAADWGFLEADVRELLESFGVVRLIRWLLRLFLLKILRKQVFK